MTAKSTAADPAIPLPALPSKTIEELAAEQRVRIPQDFDRLIGAGAMLWDSDAEFDEFLSWLNENRRKES